MPAPEHAKEIHSKQSIEGASGDSYWPLLETPSNDNISRTCCQYSIGLWETIMDTQYAGVLSWVCCGMGGSAVDYVNKKSLWYLNVELFKKRQLIATLLSLWRSDAPRHMPDVKLVEWIKVLITLLHCYDWWRTDLISSALHYATMLNNLYTWFKSVSMLKWC